jgi:hypothetical protein
MPMNPRLLVPRATFDPDAAAYLRAVEAADGQALETPVKRAVDDFFRGIKADGTFSAIRSACLLCGARTLAGALVPLVGTAPTNVADGFVSGDYTRGGATPGLKGDGTSYLDSGRAGDDDPLEDHHMACYATETSSAATHTKMGAVQSATGAYELVRGADRSYFYSRSSTFFFTGTGVGNQTGLYGYSRTGSTLNSRALGVDYTATRAAVARAEINIFVFGYNDGSSLVEPSQGRLAFYSIGEDLDLALLDARVTALVTAIGAAV